MRQGKKGAERRGYEEKGGAWKRKKGLGGGRKEGVGGENKGWQG